MSDEPISNTHAPRNAKAPPAKHSNKTGILLAGAAALALLLGGGYYAWKNTGASTDSAQVADNAAPFSSPSASDEVMGTGTTGADSTGQEAAATDATTDTQTTAAALAQPKKARIAAAETPEETIGVSRAGAQTTRSNEVVVNGRRPVWRYTPRPERLAEYYPADALERGREGEASLHCMVQKKGVLDCTRVSETPARAGFGVAALRVARTFRHAEQRADGRNAIGTPINLHVVFRMADGERRG